MGAPNSADSDPGTSASPEPVTIPLDIALINDHRLSREGVRLLFERLDGQFHVSTEAVDDSEAIDQLRAHPPDIVLIDLTARENGSLVTTIQAIKSVHPKTQVVVIGPVDSPTDVVRVIRAGANGYLTRSAGIDEVVQAMRVVAAGGSWIDPLLTPIVMDEYRKLTWPGGLGANGVADLAQRDREFLRLLAAGQNNRQISESIGLAESTVKNNLSALFRKLGVRDRTQAVLYAIEHGIVAPGGDQRL